MEFPCRRGRTRNLIDDPRSRGWQQFAPPARTRGQELHTHSGDRQYRGRVEILRDFLGAVRANERKTRIIGLANLNPNSFRRYLDFCLALDLVERSPGGYRLTPRADAVLQSIERLLAKSDEVDATLHEFERAFSRSQVIGPGPQTTLRYVSRIAWENVSRTTEGSAMATRFAPRSTALASSAKIAPWSDPGDPPDPKDPRDHEDPPDPKDPPNHEDPPETPRRKNGPKPETKTQGNGRRARAQEQTTV